MAKGRSQIANVTLAEYQPHWLDELVVMWRESFEAAVGVTDPHPLEEQQQHFVNVVLPQHAVRLALVNGKVVGFVAASPESISQLYIRVGYQRQGIGSMLLEWARNRSSGSLWLYTFARNHGACAFYERSGFVVVETGFEPMWQLEDVKYQWTRP